MIKLLFKKYCPDIFSDPSESDRSKCSYICGLIGIILNIFLFAIKFIGGSLTSILSIKTDAFNNLSDTGSLLVSMIGTKLANKKSDSDHPFGHGRIEYLAGLFVSMLIFLMGYELLKDSIVKIFEPSEISNNYFLITCIFLLISILVKFYMFIFYKKFGTLISSSSMIALSKDSISDCISTFGVLISAIIIRMTKLYVIDGIIGAIISILIIYTGISSAKDTISPLLGRVPEKDFIKRIESIVMSHDMISGIHDLIVHDYGPGRIIISLHAEVPQDINILTIHDEIDNIENELNEKLHCVSVIHMDPINTDDPHTLKLKNDVNEIVKSVDQNLTMHDFRIVNGKTHTNMIFDVCMPADSNLNFTEIKNEIQRKVYERYPKHNCVITVEYSYVN